MSQSTPLREFVRYSALSSCGMIAVSCYILADTFFVAQGLGTSMLQMPNIVKNPRIWIPPTLASAITGPIATCVFGLEMNGAPINSGMGTCGLCGQIGVWTGWLAPSEEALARGAAAIVPTSFDWLGMILICFVLPAVLSWAFCQILRKIGWIREGDLTLPQ